MAHELHPRTLGARRLRAERLAAEVIRETEFCGLIVSRRRASVMLYERWRVDPSKSLCRRRLQTAMSCFGQKPRW